MMVIMAIVWLKKISHATFSVREMEFQECFTYLPQNIFCVDSMYGKKDINNLIIPSQYL